MIPAAPLRILIVAALSVLGLVALVVHEGLVRDAGTEVAMTMQPLDPQSLLSGDYVTVALGETLGAGQTCPPGAADGAATTAPPRRWVALASHAGHYSVAGVAATAAAARAFAPLVVRGEASCFASPPTIPPQVSADLGVSRFHVSKEEAERIGALTTAPPTSGPGPVLALISIGGDGKARMKGLVVNGRRLMLTWF